MKVLAFGASRSSQSINRQLANFAAQQIPGVEVTDLDLRTLDLPIYSADEEEANGAPGDAVRFLELIRSHDAVVVSMAEAAMVRLGYRAHNASRVRKAFAKNERERAQELASIQHDEKAFLDTIREHVGEMERQFKQDHKDYSRDADRAWDTQKIRFYWV